MPLKTTVVGAWPKPSYLPLPNWFGGSSIGQYNPNMKTGVVADVGKEDLEELIKKAVKEVTSDQVKNLCFFTILGNYGFFENSLCKLCCILGHK